MGWECAQQGSTSKYIAQSGCLDHQYTFPDWLETLTLGRADPSGEARSIASIVTAIGPNRVF